MDGGQSLTELSVPIGLLLAERAVASLNKKTKKQTKTKKVVKQTPAKNSPHATKNHTVIGRPNDCASEISRGNFDNPCKINTIERGTRMRKLAPLKSGIFFIKSLNDIFNYS